MLQLLQKCEIDEKDIALLISGIQMLQLSAAHQTVCDAGVPEIDVLDWQNGCDVPGSSDAKVVSWLWEVLEELPMEVCCCCCSMLC